MNTDQQNVEKATCRHGESVTLVPVVERHSFTGRERTGVIEVGCLKCLRDMKPVPRFSSVSDEP